VEFLLIPDRDGDRRHRKTVKVSKPVKVSPHPLLIDVKDAHVAALVVQKIETRGQPPPRLLLRIYPQFQLVFRVKIGEFKVFHYILAILAKTRSMNLVSS
jgi:hypothetical protein